jgi:hypothetical protein
MLEDIKEIIKAGTMAPSGDNSQPWRFEIEQNELRIFNLPDRDNPFLNFGQRGSYIAHGGLIENIDIAASNLGYCANITLFPDNANDKCVAKIIFEKNNNRKKDELYDFLFTRHTNRKPYTNDKLNDTQREYITSSLNKIEGGFVKLIDDKEKKKIAGRAGSSAEIVILENKTLHGYLFDHIVWSESEERQKKTGLYINTMEFNPVQKILFKLARNWHIMKLAIKIGFSKFIAKEDAKLYSTGAALGIIVIKDNSKESYIVAGRIMQRVWLKTEKMGLSLQPVTATLFFMQRILANDTEDMTVQHIKLLKSAYTDIQNAFDIKDNTIAMMFRIGYANKPSARSSRQEPNIRISN